MLATVASYYVASGEDCSAVMRMWYPWVLYTTVTARILSLTCDNSLYDINTHCDRLPVQTFKPQLEE